MLAEAAAQKAIAETLRPLAPGARLKVLSSASRAFLDEPDDLPLDFPTRLRTYRLARGLGQTDLARIAGVSHSVISVYELGRARPSRPTLDRLTAALGVDAETLAIDRESCSEVPVSPYARPQVETVDDAPASQPNTKPMRPKREPRGGAGTPKTPRTIAIDQTVALAIVRGEITNRVVVAFTGLSHKGADKRIQFSAKAGRIERVRNGVYVAAASEYQRLGLDASKQGHSDPTRKVSALAERLKELREAEESRK